MIKSSTDKVLLSFEDGIFKVEIKEGEHLEVPDFKNIFKERKKMIGDQDFAVLVDSQTYHTSSSDARDFLAAYNPSNQVAVAIVSKIIAIRLLANFYLNISKPLCPTKLVKTMEEGEEWLRKQLSMRKSVA